MKFNNRFAIAATMIVASMAASCLLSSCEGRKMSNMKPKGETVEVVVDPAPTTDQSVESSSHK